MPPKELTKADVLVFIEMQTGAFTTMQIKEYMDIQTHTAKATLYVIMGRLEKEGYIQQLAPGVYRKRNIQKVKIDWKNANPNAYLSLILPFELHKLCKIYPRSIIIVAGGKNAGKTAFLLKTAALNYGLMPVEFFNSETGPEQLNDRIQCYNNFSDQIDPNKFTVIDYLDCNSEVYRVGEEIDNLFRKTNHCVVIGLQKPPNTISTYKGKTQITERDLAYGGGFSAKRAVLYVSMGMINKSTGKLKIIYAKNPMNPKVNPNNMQWTYNFDDNGYFTNIQPFYETTDADNEV
jgi:hypothetical protein